MSERLPEPYPERGGEVYLQGYNDAPVPSGFNRGSTGSAWFWSNRTRATATQYGESCSVYAWGDCSTRWPTESVNAGRIDIVGLKEPMSLEFSPSTAGYQAVTAFSSPLVPGAAISIRGSGNASLPAFGASIVAPASIRITQPQWPVWGSGNGVEGQPKLLLRAQDGLELRWEASPGSGRVTARFVTVVQENPLCVGRRRVLECSFARDDLRATIPASALLAIAAVPGAMVQLSIGTETSETVMAAPEFPVRVIAFNPAETLAPDQIFGGVARGRGMDAGRIPIETRNARERVAVCAERYQQAFQRARPS